MPPHPSRSTKPKTQQKEKEVGPIDLLSKVRTVTYAWDDVIARSHGRSVARRDVRSHTKIVALDVRGMNFLTALDSAEQVITESISAAGSNRSTRPPPTGLLIFNTKRIVASSPDIVAQFCHEMTDRCARLGIDDNALANIFILQYELDPMSLTRRGLLESSVRFRINSSMENKRDRSERVIAEWRKARQQAAGATSITGNSSVSPAEIVLKQTIDLVSKLEREFNGIEPS